LALRGGRRTRMNCTTLFVSSWMVALAAACAVTVESAPEPSPPSERGHTFQRAGGGGRGRTAPVAVTASAPVDAAAVLAAGRAEMREVLGALEAADFRVESRVASAGAASAQLQHLALRQMVGGVPIEGGYLHVTLGGGAAQPRLLAA